MVEKLRTLLDDVDDKELNEAIRQAEEAERQINEATEIQEKARSLQGLKQQRAQIEAIRLSESTLSAVTRQTEDRLAKIESAVSQWKDEFSKASYDIEQLISEFVPITKEILSAGYSLRKASESAYYRYHPEKLSMGDSEADSSSIPGIFEASSGFEMLWQQVGGMSSGLDVFGKLEGVSALLKALIVESSKVNPYLPSKGTKYFRRR
jgi:phage-related tail protein